MNEINADPDKVPKSILEVYQHASTWIAIDTNNPWSGGKEATFSTGNAIILNSCRQKRNLVGRKNKNDTEEPRPPTNDPLSVATTSASSAAANPNTLSTVETATRAMSQVECYL